MSFPIFNRSTGETINFNTKEERDQYVSDNDLSVYQGSLPELTVTAKRSFTQSPQFQDIFGSGNPIFGSDRVNINRRASQRNSNFYQNYDMLGNIAEGVNVMSGGFLNRLSPTQNLRLLYDIATGENVIDSWFGNNGIVSNQFTQNHPYWSLAINGIPDLGTYSLLGRLRTTSSFRDPNKVYHSDKGNGTGFTGSGAYIKNGRLHPGQTRLEGQANYTWWNEGEPFSPGFSPKKPVTRMIVADKDLVPGLMRVREQPFRIGQWNPNVRKSFVRKSEMVSTEPLPMQNADVYRRIPRTNLWFRTNTAGSLGRYGIQNAATNFVRPYAISWRMNHMPLSTQNTGMPSNVGWGPKQTIPVTHKSNSARPLQLFNPERWDVINEGANPLGIWWQGKLGIPRTILTGNTVKQAEKAANARQLFEHRPYTHSGDLTLKKPLVTVGDVPNRSALSYQAEQLGADGIIYNNVYDNGYNANQVILGFRHPDNYMLTARAYKGGPRKSSDYEFFTTDPKYAHNFGQVKPYYVRSKFPVVTDTPLMGSRDISTMDAFAHDIGGGRPIDAIIGHDKVTGEFPYISQGDEILIFNPNQARLIDESPRLSFQER